LLNCTTQVGSGKSGLPDVKYQAMSKAQKRAAAAASAANEPDDIFFSIFPVENEELAYGRWEDEIIWDADDMPVVDERKKLRPKMVSLDPNDDNIILGIPDDIDPSTLPPDQPVRKVKVIQKHVKKSRMLLNRSGEKCL
jgi:transcription initiation factor TFIID subunit 1